MVLCVDGTSCCKKTSILAATGIPDVLKVQKNRKFVNANSYAPSMLGYISTGILDIMSATEPKFMDRSPLNVLEWHFLWKFMDKFYTMFGNMLPDVENDERHIDFFNEFDRLFIDLKNYCYIYSRWLDVVCIIDSNIDRCDGARMRRNVGTDYERSNWKFYTFMQNRMYSVLHKCIDLVWFDSENMECAEVVVVIATYLRNVVTKFPKLSQRHHGRMDFALPVPVNDVDFTLKNYSTFVYREIIRQSAQNTIRQSVDNQSSWEFDLNSVPQIIDIHKLPNGRHFELEPFSIDAPSDHDAGSTTDACDDVDFTINDNTFMCDFFE